MFALGDGVSGVRVGDVERQVFADLRALCKDSLTDYMMPKYFTAISEVPLSTNGKIQREKLAKPEQLEKGAGAGSNSKLELSNGVEGACKPRNRVEEGLVSLYSELLGSSVALEMCCKTHSFFDLGGNSVLAIKLIYMIKQKYSGYLLPIQVLFSSSTIYELGDILSPYVVDHPMNEDDDNVEDETTSESLMSKIELSTTASSSTTSGNKMPPVLILFNPAGASALCYMELTNILKDQYTVVALDDNILLSSAVDEHKHGASDEYQISKPFATIDDVVAACIPLVQSIAKEFGRYHLDERSGVESYDVVLGGW